jgi:hypothetical protein
MFFALHNIRVCLVFVLTDYPSIFLSSIEFVCDRTRFHTARIVDNKSLKTGFTQLTGCAFILSTLAIVKICFEGVFMHMHMLPCPEPWKSMYEWIRLYYLLSGSRFDLPYEDKTDYYIFGFCL